MEVPFVAYENSRLFSILPAAFMEFLSQMFFLETLCLLKKPLFHQDYKHILDYLGLETPAALQSSSLQH